MSMRLIKLTTPLIVLSLLVLAISAWLSLQNTRTLIASEGWVQHTQQVLGELQNVLADANGATAAERGYLLAPDPELLVPFDRSKQDATDAIGRLLTLTADNPGENARAARLRTSLQETFALLDRGVALPKAGIAGTAALAENVDAGRLAIRDIRTQIAELEAEEDRLLAARQQATSGAFRRAVVTLAAATGVAMAMVLLAYGLMRRDERARRRVAKLLGEGEARRAAIVDAVLDSIVGMDNEGRVIEWNAAAEKMFGYPRQKAVGRYMADLIIPPQYREAHSKGLAQYLRTGEGPVLNKRIEISAVRANGEEFPIELAITPITTGGPAMFTGYIRDTTESKAAEAALSQSEERGRLLLESTGEGIYGVDLDGNCTFANAACVKMLGYDAAADLLGEPTHALMHHTKSDGSSYPREECPIYRAFTSGEDVEVDDEVFWRKDGSSFPVEYRSSPLVRDGRVSGAVITFSDATERRRSEEGMRLRDNALRSINQGVFITDPRRSDEPITYVNEAFEELTGYAARDAIGRQIDFLAGPDTDRSALKLLQDALARRREQTTELCLYRSDGGFFWGTVSLAPVEDEQGRVTFFVGVVTDVTARRRYEEQLERARADAEAAKEQAEEANVSKSQFLANMSHELRTPLNAVIMYSELLQEEAVDEGVESFVPDLDKIRNAGKHLLSLVNGVLDLSKIEAGKMELYLETFGIDPMIRDVATTVQPLVETHKNALELDVAGDVGEMHADLTKVRQVLFNLLSNACKFTEGGTIRVSVRRDGGDVTMAVADSGIGMTDEQLGRLFQAFTQADASTTRKYGGTGLGLVISKRFCEMMGGTIAVTSAAGEGTTFTVTLPARVAEPAPAEPPPAEEVGSPGDPRRGTVLVIDDDPGVREVIGRTLTDDGVRVVAAADGVEGLRLAAELRPTLIFLDVMMPKMDGWAVLTQLKNDPALRDIPVVMLTLVNASEMGYVLGASEYLGKPIDRDRLANVLSKYRRGDQGGDGPEQVLIVEDDPATREVLRRSLVKQGWAVAEAANGRVALDRVRENVPALILLDLQMPEMDGFEFLEELRNNPEWASVPPVVVLTSKDLTQDERDFLTGQVERVVQKGTYSREALLREVRRITADHSPGEPEPAGEPVGMLPQPHVIGENDGRPTVDPAATADIAETAERN